MVVGFLQMLLLGIQRAQPSYSRQVCRMCLLTTLHVLPEYSRNRCNKAALTAVLAAGPLGVSKEELTRRGEEVEQILKQRRDEDTRDSRVSGEYGLKDRSKNLFRLSEEPVEEPVQVNISKKDDGKTISKL